MRAVFVDRDRTVRDMETDGHPTWDVPMWAGRKVSLQPDELDAGRSKNVVPVIQYRKLGELPNGTLVYVRTRCGLIAWVLDQHIRGPQGKGLADWQREVKLADEDLDQALKLRTGVDQWPGIVTRYPPYLILAQETRMIIETNGNIYHRRSQGVCLERLM